MYTIKELINDCNKFAKLYNEKTNRHFEDKVNGIYIGQMICDELEEFQQAQDETEVIDAFIDIIYYCLHHLSNSIISESILNDAQLETEYDISQELTVKNIKDIVNILKDLQLIVVTSSNDIWRNNNDKIVHILKVVSLSIRYLQTKNLNINPIWDLVHNANMKKFGPGGRMEESGKWKKPADFKSPDNDIRKEIKHQRDLQ